MNIKKENKVRKWKQRIAAAEVNNPELAKRLRGKLASFEGKK